MAASLYIGTSGWSYPGWKDSFYQDIPQRQWLAHYARHFNTVEINASFYRLQTPQTFERWCEAVPGNFRFSLKANRYLTHNKKLLDPLPSIAIERERSRALGKKLSAVLWQLPRSYRKNLQRLHDFVAALKAWPEPRHVVEFRHASWFDREVVDCLADGQVAICQSDAADWPLWDAVTTDLVYVRLHGHTRTYASSYSPGNLRRWAERVHVWLQTGHVVYVFFDNDAEGAAPRNAITLKQFLEEP